MLKQILLKLIVFPAAVLLVSAGIYYAFLVTGGHTIIQEPTGVYTQIDPPASDPTETPEAPVSTPKPSPPPPKSPAPTPPKTSSPKPAAKSATVPKQDPSLYVKDNNLYRELARIAKFSTPSLTLKYSSNPGEACRSGVAVGCYLPAQDLIWLSSKFKTNESFRRDILAHEYMHYIWHHLGIGTSQLKSTLTAKYASSPGLKATIDSSYVINGQVDPNEILAYSCTTLNKKQMGATIYSVCNKYLHLGLLSPFIKSSPTKLIGAINYLREKQGLSGLSTSSNLNKAAESSLPTLIAGSSLSSLKNDPNVTVNIRTGCHVRQYNLNFLQTTASDELYLAEHLTSNNKELYFSKQLATIGVAIQKVAYSQPKSSPKPLVNSNIIVAISC